MYLLLRSIYLIIQLYEKLSVTHVTTTLIPFLTRASLPLIFFPPPLWDVPGQTSEAHYRQDGLPGFPEPIPWQRLLTGFPEEFSSFHPACLCLSPFFPVSHPRILLFH